MSIRTNERRAGIALAKALRDLAVGVLRRGDQWVSGHDLVDALRIDIESALELFGERGGQAAAVRYSPEVILYDAHAAVRNSRVVDGVAPREQLIDNTSDGQGTTPVPMVVPWGTLGIVFSVVYAASLITTLLPALSAARLEPAQALRYE